MKKMVVFAFLIIIALTLISLIIASVYMVKTKRHNNEIISTDELFVSHASQLALLYRLRRECSITSVESMSKHMDRIQDKLIVNLADYANTLSSHEDKEKIRLVLSAIADSTIYGYGNSSCNNIQEQDLHNKAVNVLAESKKDYQNSSEEKQEEKLENVKKLNNVKPKGFYTGKTNTGDNL